MKAILEFNLPEDSELFETANKAPKLYCALYDISQYLRKLRKYENKTKIDIEELTNEFYSILKENNIHDETL